MSMTDDSRQVEIRDHDPQWVTSFRQEAAILQAIFGQEVAAIHHIGSTSVPELPAKPIIDILLEVRDIDKVDLFNQQMRDFGYEPRGEYGLPRRRYFPRIDGTKHSSHIHTWQTGDPEIDRHVSFRDYLISHPQMRHAYGCLKEDLAARFPADKERYIDGKHEFCQEVERHAIRWQREVVSHAVQTERLTLLPLTPAQLWHYLNRPSQLEAALHLTLSRAVLTAPVSRAIRTKLRNTASTSLNQLLWNTYWLVVIREDSSEAGLLGFKGAPGQDGASEIGYGINPNFRRQGYATEAVEALTAWALSQSGCEMVTAFTEKGNLASIRVLEKSGFTMSRETDEEFYWTVAGAPGGDILDSGGK